MQQYYFHIRGGDLLDLDRCGQELEGIDAAREEASNIMNQLLESWPTGWPQSREHVSIEVVDRAGKTVLQLPFRERARDVAVQAQRVRDQLKPYTGHASPACFGPSATRVANEDNKKAL